MEGAKLPTTLQIMKKWQKLRIKGRMSWRSKCIPVDVPEGHLAVYVGGKEMKKRFVISATYVNHPLFCALLDKAEEFGLNGNGPILIPCHPLIFEYCILFPLRTNVGLSQREIEQIIRHCCYSSSCAEYSCAFSAKKAAPYSYLLQQQSATKSC